MSYDVKKLTRLQDLKTLASTINDNFATKDEVAGLATAFKSGEVTGNTVKLYTSEDKSGTPAFSFDFPAELFLDQAKTQFVPEFAFMLGRPTLIWRASLLWFWPSRAGAMRLPTLS